ncbi:hypothetical protein GCM10007036_16500 [Alsobacter metallidurans]|uniref:Uncharacterized protein n=1 Tax=Alsobacter metallidurans TaxID=340221 RepID=A0A917I6D4_9HYPH|nr:hypothetical protein [Alsobacter metallidurans]GGH16096.1 hypothetical protein GCM10007036_16500 [Alsobacter metallidurans]
MLNSDARASYPDVEVLSVPEAAAIAGRSVSWVWTQRTFGRLRPAMLNGRQAVVAESLFILIADRARRRQKPALKLVVNN